MGERILRPGIRTSDKTEALIRDKDGGGWFAQVLYDWMITKVDDYGRYDARPAILKAEVFPLLLDLVREADIQRSLIAMQRAGLIRLYVDGGKPFLEYTNWKQRLRAANSKFPAPPSGAGDCHDNVVTMPTDTETDTETDTKLLSGVPDVDDSMTRFWESYPAIGRNRSSKKQVASEWKKQRCNSCKDEVLRVLQLWVESEIWKDDGGQYVPGAHRFLAKRKWETPPIASREDWESGFTDRLRHRLEESKQGAKQ